jgi:hypothetical protein
MLSQQEFMLLAKLVKDMGRVADRIEAMTLKSWLNSEDHAIISASWRVK